MTQDTLSAIKNAADTAIARGDARSASALFEQATGMAPDRLELWLGLAACKRALGKSQEALDAIEAALAIDPRCFPALLMKGGVLESAGQLKPAAAIYGTVCQLAPPPETLPEPTRRALARAAQIHRDYVADLVGTLKRGMGLTTDAPRNAEDRRINTFIDTLAGVRKIYPQEPVSFHYPGMPTIEFYERDLFPWLADVEAYTDRIREEALAVWRGKQDELAPYVNYPKGVPLDQWADLNTSLNWSAFHFFLDGAPIEDHCKQCPATMEAVAHIDQPTVPGRSPAAMFSILRPHTRIPPHTGVANTRLVLHLPLIIPEKCGFRVGGETREWREGEAWVFDDTINHEAWNDSDQPRAILICDVWSPFLSSGEREAIAAVLGALDAFNGTTYGETGL